jgi:serine phosphatase RsbU (regulator of sigma subunit)
MAAQRGFSLRYKFFLAQAATLLVALTTLMALVGYRFYEDKKIYIRDLTMTSLEAASNAFQLLVKSRIDRIEQLAPKIRVASDGSRADLTPLSGALDNLLANELYQITLLFEEGGKFRPGGTFVNAQATARSKLTEVELGAISALGPPPFASPNATVAMANRTPAAWLSLPNPPGILTIALRIWYGDRPTVLLCDFDATFLMRELSKDELVNRFLIRRDGALVAHSDVRVLMRNSARPFSYPLVARFREVAMQAENYEIEFEGTHYFATFGAAGFPDLFLVVQTPQSQLWGSLIELGKQAAVIGTVIGYFALVFSMIFARKLTNHLATLKRAADRVGSGDFGFRVKIQSNDEVASVARSFNDMTSRIRELLEESMIKARMEDELNTASLIQSTLLAEKKLDIPHCDYAFHYASASECSGDFWDVFVYDQRVTLAVADATGHGVSAAIVTAVAKSCLTTMNYIFNQHVLPPESYLMQLNNVIHSACQGRLLMTMCLAQIDLRDGTIRVANAGHEFPLCFRAGTADHDHPSRAVEELVARGERLGFAPDTEYESQEFKLRPGDSLLLYTDGIVENTNREGKPWGERLLRKTFGEAALANSKAEHAAAAMRDALVSRHREFVRGAPPKDDVTFVTFRWGSPGQQGAAPISPEDRASTEPASLSITLKAHVPAADNEGSSEAA